jgi:predicted neutral ceramidase superfamily lipid hydrolase
MLGGPYILAELETVVSSMALLRDLACPEFISYLLIRLLYGNIFQAFSIIESASGKTALGVQVSFQ